MAISKTFDGLRRGSTKSKTYQVLNGYQITKDRVYDVKNPRTQSQMVQRMVMATASAAYAAMREICNHSFEGVTYGQPTMSKFVSVNAKLLRKNLNAQTSKFAYNEFQDRGLKPGAYQLSEGSLPVPTFNYTASSGEGQMTVTLLPNGITAQTTSAQLAALLGLSIGEMATICMIYGNQEATGYNFGFIRIKCLAADNTVITTANFGDYFAVEQAIGTETITVATTGVSIALGNVDINDATAIARAVIYSRQGAQGWLRSKAVIAIPNGMTLTPTATTAIATYPISRDYILNGGNF